jgi:hypothetical protein
LGSFTRVSTAVRSALEEALTRILTPKRSIDVLREVRAVRGRGRPYTIVFVGVNGVGKSTNLAKVAYWLLQNGAKASRSGGARVCVCFVGKPDADARSPLRVRESLHAAGAPSPCGAARPGQPLPVTAP